MENVTFKKVDLTESHLLEQIYRLRFQVYAVERAFIDKRDYPDGKESDKYDPQSIHFAAVTSLGEVIGTLRLILPGPHLLPIHQHCPYIEFESSFEGAKFAEISRLVIDRKWRCRSSEEGYEPPVEFFQRSRPMALGLYREMYRESERRGITHWYSLMEKRLSVLLRLQGFNFECIGPEANVFGPVHPYLADLAKMARELSGEPAGESLAKP